MYNETNSSTDGRLGILVVGLGAVSTTFITGVLMARKGLAKPIGSLTQMDDICKDKPLAGLNDIVFGAWDVYPQNAFQSAMYAGVLQEKDILPVRDELEQIVPMPAAFDKNYVKRIDGDNVKHCSDRWDMMLQVRKDIQQFRNRTGVSRIVVAWAASTEIYVAPDMQVHDTLEHLEAAMHANDCQRISPSMCYAYAAMMEGCPFIMGAPNTTIDIPAMWQLADEQQVPIAGKDFKTGQTLVKSGFAPILSVRQLGLNGWFSTNILGNRDGLVLDEPANFHTKEVSKLSTLETILDGEERPELYGDYYHKVRINYYPPRGDNKESWDNIDIFGWMGYPMQIKINFLCRDSILAAPVLLDLCLLIDLALRRGLSGTQRWLSFFLKAPMHDYTKGEHPVNDLFKQYEMLKEALT